MKTYEMVFSPTGGTKKVAALLTGAWTDRAMSVDLTDGKADFHGVALTPEDMAVIAVPSYGGRVPAPAVKRLAAIQGGGARAVLVCVYGNRAYEDTLVELLDAAKQAGFRVIAAVAAVAEHSIAHQFATGRPDAQDAEQLVAFAGQIRGKMAANDLSEPVVPGNRPYKKAGGEPAWCQGPPRHACSAGYAQRRAPSRQSMQRTPKKWMAAPASPACAALRCAPIPPAGSIL